VGVAQPSPAKLILPHTLARLRLRNERLIEGYLRSFDEYRVADNSTISAEALYFKRQYF